MAPMLWRRSYSTLITMSVSKTKLRSSLVSWKVFYSLSPSLSLPLYLSLSLSHSLSLTPERTLSLSHLLSRLFDFLSLIALSFVSLSLPFFYLSLSFFLLSFSLFLSSIFLSLSFFYLSLSFFLLSLSLSNTHSLTLSLSPLLSRLFDVLFLVTLSFFLLFLSFSLSLSHTHTHTHSLCSFSLSVSHHILLYHISVTTLFSLFFPLLFLSHFYISSLSYRT